MLQNLPIGISLIFCLLCLFLYFLDMHKLVPNMLKNLPIIPSQNFYPLFFFYSHGTTNYFFYSFVSVIILQCTSDYILFT